jgi:hypothetical protein
MAAAGKAQGRSAMKQAGHDALVQAVQANCNIADARHAADLSLCIYLLQMRELFRWERGLAFGAEVNRESLAQWLACREGHWSEIEDRPWLPLPIGGRAFDAHDVEGVNAALAPLGLVYGAGLAGADRPTCFLASLEESKHRSDGLTLQICGREHARGLFAPPASLVGGRVIVLRRESLARWLWEKFEAFSLRRAAGPMQAVADAYALHDTRAFVAALPRLVDDLCDSLVLHEVGEHRAGLWLEPGWAAMRLALDARRTDLRVRAVRDHIADLEVTLPALIAHDDGNALHFWFANYEGLREQMFPALRDGYAAWRGGDAGRALLSAARIGAAHFRGLAAQILGLHERLGRQATPAIEQLLTAPQAVCMASSG